VERYGIPLPVNSAADVLAVRRPAGCSVRQAVQKGADDRRQYDVVPDDGGMNAKAWWNGAVERRARSIMTGMAYQQISRQHRISAYQYQQTCGVTNMVKARDAQNLALAMPYDDGWWAPVLSVVRCTDLLPRYAPMPAVLCLLWRCSAAIP